MTAFSYLSTTLDITDPKKLINEIKRNLTDLSLHTDHLAELYLDCVETANIELIFISATLDQQYDVSAKANTKNAEKLTALGSQINIAYCYLASEAGTLYELYSKLASMLLADPSFLPGKYFSVSPASIDFRLASTDAVSSMIIHDETLKTLSIAAKIKQNAATQRDRLNDFAD
jgi:hypothetical protein